MPDIAFPAGHQHQAVRLSQKSSETTAQLFRALDIQPPAHTFFKVMKNIQVCVSAAVGDRKRIVREFEDLRASIDTALGEYDPLAPFELELLPPNSSDTLKFFLKSLDEPHAHLMEAAGNLVLIALLKNKTVSGGKMARLLTLLRAMEKKPELSRQEVEQIDRLVKESHLTLLDLLHLKDRSQGRDAFLVDSMLYSHLCGSINSEHPATQKAVDGRMFLAGDLLKQQISDRLALLEAGDWASLTVLIATVMGLPWRIATETQLAHGAHRPNGMFWLDVEQGVLHVDLTTPLRDLGQATAGSRPHRDVLRLCLPKKLAQLLRLAVADCPRATKLCDLHLDANRFGASDFDESSERATLIRSTAVYASRLSGQRAIAAYAFLSFNLIDPSDLHYIALTESSIWNLRSDVFEALGLGPSEPLNETGESVGSKRCPTSAHVQAIFKELEDLVESQRVQRRSSLKALIDFHNAYARYVAMHLQLVAGARRTHEIEFLASSWFCGSIFGYLDDKAVGIAGGKTPLHIGPTTQYQLELWEAHLRSLASRMEKLLGVRSKSVVAHVNRVLARDDISTIFVLSVDATPQQLASADLFVGVPAKTNRDFGRHYFASELCMGGTSLADVQGFLRHQGNHINAQCSLGHESHQGRIQRLCDACEKILDRTRVYAIQGLSKGSR